MLLHAGVLVTGDEPGIEDPICLQFVVVRCALQPGTKQLIAKRWWNVREDLRNWLQATLTTVSTKSELATAIRYALTRWAALSRYVGDGRIEIDNNAAERSLRDVALGRKNYLVAGSDAGGERSQRSIACWARRN